METSLPLSLSHSIKTLKNISDNFKDVYNKTVKVVENICDIDEDSDEYNIKVRKITNDYIENSEKNLNKIKIDFELLQKDFDTLIKEKHDESVIYNLRTYLDLYKKIKSLSEEFDDIIDVIKDELKESRYVDNFTIHANFNKILHNIAVYKELNNKNKNRLETLLDINKDKKKKS